MAKKAKIKKSARKKSATKNVAARKPAPQKPLEPQQADPAAKLHATMRRIDAAFTRRVPAAAASSGAHEPDKGNPVKADGVKNGVYRREGSDWLIHVRNGLVVLFEKARTDLDPESIVNIPAGAPDADKTPQRPA